MNRAVIQFFLQVIYLDETAEEKDVVKSLKTGARWLVFAPTIRPQVQQASGFLHELLMDGLF